MDNKSISPGEWFVFGVHPVTGSVDISNADGDIAQKVRAADAEFILKAKDFIEKLASFGCDWGCNSCEDPCDNCKAKDILGRPRSSL